MVIYNVFVRPHLGYSDILYDKVYKNTFHEKIQLTISTIQYYKNEFITTINISYVNLNYEENEALIFSFMI